MAKSDTNEALRLLIERRDRLNRAIEALQGGSEAQQRRGRPPGSKSAKKAAKRRRGRPPMSETERNAASERMKKCWAQRRQAAKNKAKD